MFHFAQKRVGGSSVLRKPVQHAPMLEMSCWQWKKGLKQIPFRRSFTNTLRRIKTNQNKHTHTHTSDHMQLVNILRTLLDAALSISKVGLGYTKDSACCWLGHAEDYECYWPFKKGKGTHVQVSNALHIFLPASGLLLGLNEMPGAGTRLQAATARRAFRKDTAASKERKKLCTHISSPVQTSPARWQGSWEEHPKGQGRWPGQSSPSPVPGGAGEMDRMAAFCKLQARLLATDNTFSST